MNINSPLDEYTVSVGRRKRASEQHWMLIGQTELDSYVHRGWHDLTILYFILHEVYPTKFTKGFYFANDFGQLLKEHNAIDYLRSVYGLIHQDIERVLTEILPDAHDRGRVADALAPMILTFSVEGRRTEFFKKKCIEYKTWKQTNKKKDAIEFVKTVYGAHIELGMTQRDLRDWDYKGYEAFHNRCRWLGVDPKSIVPSSREDVDAIVREHGRAPTYAESVGRAFREATRESKRLSRAYDAVRRRKSEAKKKQGPSPA